MAVSVDLIKKLRAETRAGIMDCRTALENSDGDLDKAREYLRKKGLERAEKKADRETNAGLIYSYIHGDGQMGSLIEIACETDFVARTEDFQTLCKEVAMQVVSMNPENVEDLLKQPYIRDSKQSIDDLVKGSIAKLGENITVVRFTRYALGDQ